MNIVGPTGSGKTTLVEQFCARTNRPFFRFNGRGDMEAGPILGMMHVRDQETVWEDGVFTEAVKKGATVLFD
ncbi:MAG: AAA family ATPase, partial [Desulfobacterales bacterium]|nr:AAA family ATPase [Desulfobacterales bacterium]